MTRITFSRFFFFLLLGVLLVSARVSAESVAVYGSTSGFNTSLHTEYGTFFVIPGQSGALLDESIDNFTAHSISLIFIGNDSAFSTNTAAAIEQAVWDGRILVISYPATLKFSDSLPLVTEKVTTTGGYLESTDTTDPVSRKISFGTGLRFNITGSIAEHIAGSPKPGTVLLLKYDSGEPALAYRKYGNGYVIEWAMASPESILGEDTADRIDSDIIDSLLGPLSPPVVQAALTPENATASETPVPALSPQGHETGNITVQSNPLGATVFIDGIYQGTTPIELGGFTPGYHAVKMTMDGRYDYDGSVFVVSGERITAFGSLPRQEQPGAAVNTQPATSPAATSAPASEPLSNPSVIVATIGVVTAGIGAFATIYSQKLKGKKE